MKPKAKAEAEVRVGRYRFPADELGRALAELLTAKRSQRIGEALLRELFRRPVRKSHAARSD